MVSPWWSSKGRRLMAVLFLIGVAAASVGASAASGVDYVDDVTRSADRAGTIVKEPIDQQKQRLIRGGSKTPDSSVVDDILTVGESHPERLLGEGGEGGDITSNTSSAPSPATVETTTTVSTFFQFETYKWTQRKIEAQVQLDIDTFRQSLQEASTNQCGMGITATLFDSTGQEVLQETVGTNYHDLSSSVSPSPWTSGWTGDTEFALYSNSKIFATVLFMASVVETGLGYLDEPVFTTFGDLDIGDYDETYVLTAANTSGRITPRMILSHQTGIKAYNRDDPVQDPLYSCIANVNTTLGACVRNYLLDDEAIVTTPGSVMRYSNDPFYILAELMLLKTGASDIQELMDKYINEPLGINATYNCPLVGSTPTKPHVSWGVCATGHEVPKLIQELAITHNMIGVIDGDVENNNVVNTTMPVGILSPSSVREILDFQGEIASNSDEPLPFNMPLSNCLTRTDDTEINFLMGYGLGTMITPGVKGLLFVHAATVGGYWVISPGKYSAYFAFMKLGAFPDAYLWIARIIDRFERGSQVQVRNLWDVDVGVNGTTLNVYPNEITPCLSGMFIDTTTIDDAAKSWTDCPIPVE